MSTAVEVAAAGPAAPADLIQRAHDRLRGADIAAALALAAEAEAAGDPAASAEALLIMSSCWRLSGDHAQAIGATLRAVERCRDLDDPCVEGRARGELARVLLATGETAEALQEALTAVKLVEAGTDLSALVAVRTTVGNVYLELQQYDLAVQECERAAETARLVGDETADGALQDTVACALLGMAEAAQAEGDPAGAARAALAATERSRAAMLIARRLGHRGNEATALANLAEGLALAGRPEQALALLESWRVDPRRDPVRTITHFLDTRGLICLTLGRPDEAVALFTRALDLAESKSAAMMSCEHLAEAHERNGDPVAALACYKRFHLLFCQLVSETAQRNARVAAVRLETEQAKAHAERERQRADGLQHTNVELRRMCLEDPLTGLANRRCLDDRLAEGGPAPAVVLLDVDHFKRVNDTFSHQTGDEVLRRLAGLLRASCRDTDLAARYGGEEFAVLLPGLTAEEATAAAERIRRTVEGFDWAGVAPGLAVTVSLGVAVGGTAAGLLTLADKRLYAAKAAGRNRVSG